jgi:hypothetical protein
MFRMVVSALALLALATAACGQDSAPLPAACSDRPERVLAALGAAPSPVRLAGVRLSDCVSRARSDSDLQTIGAVYTAVADSLARDVPRSDRATVQLGYLVGAARRGARRTNGIHAELVRRLEAVMGVDGAPTERRAAYERGIAAGASDG